MHVHAYEQHSHIHSCIDLEIDVNINELAEMNMFTYSLTGECATIMHILTNSFTYRNPYIL